MRKLVRMIAITGVPTLMGAITFVAPAASAATAPARALPCRASISSHYPADYTTVVVRVRTAASARVTTVAHYRTTTTTHHRRANRLGSAHIPYYISGATPGFKVIVDVFVRKGTRRGSCQTWFIPHR